MELLNSLALGFSVALQPVNLLYCFAGVFTGTLIGVLPGIGPTAAMALLLPVTFSAGPASGVIMLAGIYYGSMYGGSTTAILVNIPGEAASVVTTLDGYQMARQGQAGAALGMAAIASFIAGTFAVVGLMLLAPVLSRLAVRVGPADYFGMLVLGLSLLVCLTSGSLAKALAMAGAGLIVGLIGMDPVVGTPRMTFGQMALMDGVGLVPVIMGLFGVAEILSNLERTIERVVYETRIRGVLPTRAQWRRSAGPIARGSFIGFLLGILPGGGGVIASFVSYAMEKRLSRTPERFGTGAIEGVAGPEAANNAGAGGGFIPLMTLGIPSNVVMALLLGAFMVHGIQPGPLMMKQNPDVFWGVVASMYIGNVMLLILNLPLIGLWVQVLRIPYRILFPLILLFCAVGVYCIGHSVFDLYVMIGFGLFGYLARKAGFEPAPMVLALMLGPMLEDSLRKALILSGGRTATFIEHPVSAVSLALAVAVMAAPLLPFLGARRRRLAALEPS